jgi:DNA-3-methyladenine glycosylase II
MARKQLVEASEALVRQVPEFAPIVAEVGPPQLGPPRRKQSHFAELARMICFQQLAGKAASTIHGRFVALFDGEPTPEAVLAAPVESLRGAGLSGNKTASIRDLADKVLSGEVELDRVAKLGDDELVGELVAVRGIGRWTAEMFLMFQLGRLDVWPVDDLGVRKGYGRLFRLAAMPTSKELQPLGEPMRPYRSVAAWYCWRVADSPALDG